MELLKDKLLNLSDRAKTITAIVGLILALGSLVGVAFSVDTRYAKSNALESLSARLDRKIQEDRVNYLEERIWKFEREFGTTVANMPEGIAEVYMNLVLEYKKLTKDVYK